jgi:hypothetical protein
MLTDAYAGGNAGNLLASRRRFPRISQFRPANALPTPMVPGPEQMRGPIIDRIQQSPAVTNYRPEYQRAPEGQVAPTPQFPGAPQGRINVAGSRLPTQPQFQTIQQQRQAVIQRQMMGNQPMDAEDAGYGQHLTPTSEATAYGKKMLNKYKPLAGLLGPGFAKLAANPSAENWRLASGMLTDRIASQQGGRIIDPNGRVFWNGTNPKAQMARLLAEARRKQSRTPMNHRQMEGM